MFVSPFQQFGSAEIRAFGRTHFDSAMIVASQHQVIAL
jgi:hypothetical protein